MSTPFLASVPDMDLNPSALNSSMVALGQILLNASPFLPQLVATIVFQNPSRLHTQSPVASVEMVEAAIPCPNVALGAGVAILGQRPGLNATSIPLGAGGRQSKSHLISSDKFARCLKKSTLESTSI